MKEDNKKFLGIDYGDKRIGVAIGFLDNKISLPHKIIENKSDISVLGELKNIIREEEIGSIIVGIPYSLSSQKQESEQAKKTKDFINFLRTNLESVDIIEEDERLSTKMAEGLLRGGMKGHKDDVAAALILQSYLDRQ